MQKKVFIMLGVLVLLATNAAAQRQLKMAKQVTEAMTGGVASAFSEKSALSFVNADMVGRKIAAAQFAQTNPVYISSANLFARVDLNRGMEQLSSAEKFKLAGKFSTLDLAVKTSSYKQISYLGALFNQEPLTEPVVLALPNVRAMTDLLDVQRYMQTHDGLFPQLFTVGEDGFLRTAEGMETTEGSRAFMGTVMILIKQQQGIISPVIIEQLTNLYQNARNKVDPESLLKQLNNWRMANGNPDGVPQLPANIGGLSLRNNPEELWLATEIRLLQLTPDMELPEVLKTAQVIR